MFDERRVVPIDGVAGGAKDQPIGSCAHCGQAAELCYNCAVCHHMFVACAPCENTFRCTCSPECCSQRVEMVEKPVIKENTNWEYKWWLKKYKKKAKNESLVLNSSSS